MSIYDIPLNGLDGSPLDAAGLRGKTTLVVNVASRCGLTPQYEGLQRLYDRYSERGFSVLGVPCNQFAEQEPEGADEIFAFCSTSYGVSFPLTEKVDVNGQRRHPLYKELTRTADATGDAGDVQWNFEKFLVSPQGLPVARFRPLTAPEADELVSAIEAHLPAAESPVWELRSASEVEPGARVIVPSGLELTVTRIESPFLGRENMLCLIEDTPTRWLAQPMQATAELQVLVL